MKMKKLIYTLCASATVLFAGCNKDVVSGLAGGSDERAAAEVARYKGELMAAENGWMAGIMTSEGIYRFWMDFQEQDVVEMYTDNTRYTANNGVAQSSTYRVEAYRAPTIVFDTYSYLSIINDPDNAISGGEGNQGLNTDFEFEILDYADGKFTLRGRLNGVAASLTRASAEEYQAVKDGRLMALFGNVSSYAAGKTLQFDMDGRTVSVMLRQRNVTSVVTEGGAIDVKRTYTYMDITNGNVVLDTPLRIGDVTFSGFKWDGAAASYEQLISDTGDFKLKVVEKPSFALQNVYGMEKAFTKLRLYNDASFTGSYAALGATNPIYAGLRSMSSSMFFPGLLLGGLDYRWIDATFGYNADGNGYRLILQFAMNIGGSFYTMTYSYDIVSVNEDFSEFTLATNVYYDRNGGMLYQTPENSSSSLKITNSVVDTFAGRTFKMNWSTVKYGSEIVGELRDVSAEPNAIFIGGLVE